jgi:hypothetical protein
MKLFSFIAFIIILGAACTPTRMVKPLEKWEKAVGATLGGPLVKFGGAVIPIPFTTISGAYGVNDKLSAFGSIHTTALAFGVLQTDAGILYGISKPDKFIPGISVSAAANATIDTWEGYAKLLPQIDANAYWTYGKKKRSFFYTGISNWWEPAQFRAHQEIQAHNYFINFQVGHTFAGRKWDFNTEIKYLAPHIERGDIIVEYIGFGTKGATGVYLGITRRF